MHIMVIGIKRNIVLYFEQTLLKAMKQNFTWQDTAHWVTTFRHSIHKCIVYGCNHLPTLGRESEWRHLCWNLLFSKWMLIWCSIYKASNWLNKLYAACKKLLFLTLRISNTSKGHRTFISFHVSTTICSLEFVGEWWNWNENHMRMLIPTNKNTFQQNENTSIFYFFSKTKHFYSTMMLSPVPKANYQALACVIRKLDNTNRLRHILT